MRQTRSATAYMAEQALIVQAPDPNDLLNSGQVRKAIGNVSHMSIWRWTQERGFPLPDKIIVRRKFWFRHTINAWLATQESGALPVPSHLAAAARRAGAEAR
jgi:predicted DNA-binding transcriptional regulator AlpA